MNQRPPTLQISRQLKYDRAQVFSALTDPVKMAQWFFGMKGGSATVTNDLRPGGHYSITMTDGEHTCTPQGTYLAIDPPEKLVFTWCSGSCGPAESKVSIELIAEAGGTKLVLTHELPEAEIPPHREGWIVCFNHLEDYLSQRAGAPVPLAVH